MYSVDVNVLSVGTPARPRQSAMLIDWKDRHSDQLFLSAVTVAGIFGGIAKFHRTGSEFKAGALENWIDLVLHLYGERVLPFDASVARLAGELTDRARVTGHSPGFLDVAIAATARSRELTILTRNLRHFRPLGLPAIYPFEVLPDPDRSLGGGAEVLRLHIDEACSRASPNLKSCTDFIQPRGTLGSAAIVQQTRC